MIFFTRAVDFIAHHAYTLAHHTSMNKKVENHYCKFRKKAII